MGGRACCGQIRCSRPRVRGTDGVEGEAAGALPGARGLLPAHPAVPGTVEPAAQYRTPGDEDAVAQMLSYHEHPETRSERYHANLSRPPDPERVSAWAEALAPGEIAFVQEALGPLMRRFGYEPVAADASPPAELRHEFRRRRRRQALAHRRLLLRDRFLKLVTHRYPLAAEPDLIVSSPPAVGGGRSASGSP